MELYPLVFDVDNKRVGFYTVELSQEHPFILSFFIVTVIIIILMSVYRERQLLKKEKEEREKEQKDLNDIKDKNIKDISNNDDNNINNEKSKLKNE